MLLFKAIIQLETHWFSCTKKHRTTFEEYMRKAEITKTVLLQIVTETIQRLGAFEEKNVWTRVLQEALQK